MIARLGDQDAAAAGRRFVLPHEEESSGDGPLLGRAVQFIHDHAMEPLKVQDVADAVGVSRRWLAAVFTRSLGRSPHDEIVRARFAHVERLLADTELSLSEVAVRCGFRHAEYMSVAFARRYGMPPSQWRRERREQSPTRVPHGNG